MSVYERSYRAFPGQLTPEWSRFLILPRYALRSVFQSKLFIAAFSICFAYPLIAAILIYLHHNVPAIASLKLNVAELVPIDASFFKAYVVTQGVFAFFLTVLVGPPLVSRDLANNALPLYLSRPFERREYIAGKMAVIVFLLSTFTWVPGIALFFFQVILEGWNWLLPNLNILLAIVVGCLIWILLLALLSLAISAMVRWRFAASAALIAIFFIPQIIAGICNRLFDTSWASLFSVNTLIGVVWSGLFGLYDPSCCTRSVWEGGRDINIVVPEIPLWSAWASILLICLGCVCLLFGKVRAYEQVRG